MIFIAPISFNVENKNIFLCFRNHVCSTLAVICITKKRIYFLKALSNFHKAYILDYLVDAIDFIDASSCNRTVLQSPGHCFFISRIHKSPTPEASCSCLQSYTFQAVFQYWKLFYFRIAYRLLPNQNVFLLQKNESQVSKMQDIFYSSIYFNNYLSCAGAVQRKIIFFYEGSNE